MAVRSTSKQIARFLIAEQLESRYLMAASPVPLSNLNTTSDTLNPSTLSVQVGKYAYFAGRASVTSGVELFRTDGTKAGTVLVKDINPTGSSNPQAFTNVHGTLYFFANDGTSGTELWKSDGTAAGTVRVADVRPGALGSNPQLMTAVGNILYFITYDGQTSLVRSDGTAAGTYAVRPAGGMRSPTDLVNAGGQLYFLAYADASSSSRTLFTESNGQAYAVGGAPFGISTLFAVGQRLFFTVGGAGSGRANELWTSTGNYSHTFVKALGDSSTPTQYVSDFTASGNLVYFRTTEYDTLVSSRLWRTDGTAAGTIPLTTAANTDDITPVGTRGVLFRVNTPGTGVEPWVSDGTPAGTMLLKDLVPGATGGALHFGGTTRLANGRVLFTAAFGNEAASVWTTDGTPAGTTRLNVALPSGAFVLGALNGVALLSRSIGSGGSGDLFRSDGTAAGTVRVGATLGGDGSSLGVVSRSTGPQFVTAGNTVFFAADDGVSGLELYKSVNNAPPVRITDLNPGPGNASPVNLVTTADGSLYFRASAGMNTQGIYRLTPDGTTPALVFAAGQDGRTAIDALTAVGNVVYFIAGGSGVSTQLLRYDPATAAISVALDPGPLTERFSTPVAAGGAWYVTASLRSETPTPPYATRQRLYRLSSPTADPELVTEIAAARDETSFRVLGSVGATVYFVASSADTAGELWASDGTAAGTRLVKDLSPGLSSTYFASGPHATASVGGLFYFTAGSSDASGYTVYRTDGTESGTIAIGGLNTATGELAVVGNALYAIGDGGSTSPARVYRLADGPAPAFVPVTQPGSGDAAFAPKSLLVFNNSLFVVGIGGSNARYELWQAGAAFSSFTNVAVLGPAAPLVSGTAIDSFRSPDVAFAATATDLYFPLYTPATGVEPYRLPIATATGGTLSGYTFDDKNANGVFDGSDVKTSRKTVFLDTNNNGKLDSGEKSVVSGTNGAWSFTNLGPGNYSVRRVFPSGYTLSTPPINIALPSNETVANLPIGSRSGSATPTLGSISGFAFDDKNKNGKYDTGDTLAAKKTIWLDLDDDGVKDPGEASVVTDSSGKFSFTGLAARKYHVRRQFPSGYAESTPARYVTLAAGQKVTDVSLGSKAK